MRRFSALLILTFTNLHLYVYSRYQEAVDPEHLNLRQIYHLYNPSLHKKTSAKVYVMHLRIIRPPRDNLYLDVIDIYVVKKRQLKTFIACLLTVLPL